MIPFGFVKLSRTCVPLLTFTVSVVCVLLLFGPLPSNAAPKSTAVHVVPMMVCSCSPQPATIGHGEARFRGRGPPIFQNYDEQLGITFTQSFTSIEYNVTALAQTDPSLGTGPAYLVNGLSNAGYWYQVGVSWNWAPGDTPGSGFDMSYEVFDNLGNSIFPTNGQGGVEAFSGPVKAGDIILLDLYFSSATSSVVMLADDTDTGASASETYPSMGATYFAGLPGFVANSNGYFTGLMTEWYHGLPYFANENSVVYFNPRSGLTSAWMWMDEFDASNNASVFASNTTSPVSFANPAALQEFSFNGTTEFADGFEFVTGALSNATEFFSGIPLVLSFGVQGSGTGYSPPVLNYVSNGSLRSVSLTRSPVLYLADNGTDWSVSPTLGGSNSMQRWETSQATTGVAISPMSTALSYFAQDYVSFGFNVTGGGSGFSPPLVTYYSFGQAHSTPPGVEVWADAGSKYQYQNPLPGSAGDERWFTESAGVIDHPSQISITYYNQFLVTFEVSFKNAGILPALSLLSTSAGKTYSAGLVEGANNEWLDSGATYSVPQSFMLETGQRFITNGTHSGDVAQSSTVDLVYEHQFYEQIVGNLQAGGEVSPETGWYDSGTVLQLDAVPSQGWQFEGWQGSGSDSVSGSQPLLSLTVGPGVPSEETAAFYPGVTIYVSGPSSVSYSDGSASGTVSAGATEVVYVPPASALSLTGSGIPFWTSFSGWRGATNSTSSSITISVNGPAVIDASSGYDFLGIGGSLLVIAVIVGMATALWRRRHSLGRSGTIASGPQYSVHPDHGGGSMQREARLIRDWAWSGGALVGRR